MTAYHLLSSDYLGLKNQVQIAVIRPSRAINKIRISTAKTHETVSTSQSGTFSLLNPG